MAYSTTIDLRELRNLIEAKEALKRYLDLHPTLGAKDADPATRQTDYEEKIGKINEKLEWIEAEIWKNLNKDLA